MAFDRKIWKRGRAGGTPTDEDGWNDQEGRIEQGFAGVDDSVNATLEAAKDYTDAPPVSVAISGNYTLALTDAGNVVLETVDAVARVITVPPNSSVAFALGAVIEFARIGAGTVTFAQGSGVTIQSPSGGLTIPSQYGVATLRKRATNVWHLVTGP